MRYTISDGWTTLSMLGEENGPSRRNRGRWTPSYEGLVASSARASKTARSIRKTDTKAEVALRRELWTRGLRYRKYAKGLPGNPDLVFPSRKVAVFVDGDFWHGRNWEKRRAALATGSNATYWVAKIASNMDRDKRVNSALRSLGWRVVRIWETDVFRHLGLAVSRVRAALRATDE